MLFRRLESIGRTFHHLQRAREIAGVFLKYGYEDLLRRLHLPALLDIPLKHLHRHDPAVAQLSQPQRLRRALEELGPTFIKLGQVLASRSDVLPDEFVKELTKLQDQVPAIPFLEIRRIMQAELREPLEKWYSSIDEVPLGSASIAQVHKAVFHDGSAVVIKVQRPEVRETVKVDLEILEQLAGLAEKHLDGWRVHRPVLLVQEMAKTLQRETDFNCEAAHVERFARQFDKDPTIHVPKVYHEATTQRVLTMEYIDGAKAASLVPEAIAPSERKIIAERIGDLLLKQIFVHGFFHADPHPANVHVLKGNVICFLDYGMMGFMDVRTRENLADLVWGISRQDEASVANALVRLSSADADPSRPELETDVAEFMHRHFYRPVKELEFGRLIMQLFQLTGRHGLNIPADVFVMLKALGLMETMVRRLNPEHDIIAQATPYLRKARLSRLQPNRLVGAITNFGLDMADMVRELPAEVRRIVAQVKRGEARMVFRHEGLDPVMESAERISNRLSFSVVLAAMLISSSLIIHADIPPKWHDVPIIGLIGYLIAALMGFGLLISIIRHGKM
ncbi:MAG TPA: AarF/UbiB family protein [Verrucomicrobiae bacterium]